MASEDEMELERFETELEFIQALANPFYLQDLAQRGYFEQEEFINYLNYLSYWHDPQYARFIQFPHALHHLLLLQHEAFRLALKNQGVVLDLAGKQLRHWSEWREEGSWKTEEMEVDGALHGGEGGAKATT